MRMFLLIRHQDLTGTSGTGIVAEGIEFSDGRVVLRWTRPPCSMGFFEDIGQVQAVHGHSGATDIHPIESSMVIPTQPFPSPGK
jgi:hypothetical protein